MINLKNLRQVNPNQNSENNEFILQNAAVKAAANGIAITDKNGRFLWVNPAFSKITGYSIEEVIGKKPNILKSGMHDSAFYENMWNTILSGQVWSGNVINRRKDGTLYHEEQTITPVLDDTGKITNYIGIKQDVTVRVYAQQELEYRNQVLLELNRAISIISSSLDMYEIEHNIVETVKHIFPQVSGVTLQLVDENGLLTTKTVSQYIKDQRGLIHFSPGEGAVGIAVKERKVINISDIEHDPRYLKAIKKPPFKSVICIPILFKENTFGAISVEGKIINAFGPQDERILKLLADYAASAIQNALYSEHLEEMVKERTQELQLAQEKIFAQQQIEQEIKLAVEVQESLLPNAMPDLSGFSITAIVLPAHSVSGDFYDFVDTANDGLNLVLADIAGKGMPAAMLTSMARSLVRVSAEQGCTPAEALSEVNSRLYEDLTRAEMFITMLVARVQSDNGVIKYANAGHTEALLWRKQDQSVQCIPATGFPLGIQKIAQLEELEIEFRPDDILLFYSDGITEAINHEEQFFGIERLKTLLQENSESDPEDLLRKIIFDVDDFLMGLPHSDDITLIILKALPHSIQFKYPAIVNQLDSIATLIRKKALAFGTTFAYQFELVTSEIITNIIEHAYATSTGDIRGILSIYNDKITVDFYDDGKPFDPKKLLKVDLSEIHESGYGLFIIDQLVDKVEYSPETECGNHWHLEKVYQKASPL